LLTSETAFDALEETEDYRTAGASEVYAFQKGRY